MSALDINESELVRQLLSVELREATWQQLAKDARLSGSSSFPEHVPDNLPEMMKVVASFIKAVKSNNMLWFNIKYHIDLPTSLNFESMTDSVVAKLMIYRSLQKVWLRKQLSNDQSK
ncbi:MAG: hypothetical protein R2813_06870 [Flavobacteriales bacterium]